jgi:hypothetical protein
MLDSATGRGLSIAEVAVQGGLGDAGLSGDDAEGVALGLEEPGVLDLVFGVGDMPLFVGPTR